MAAQQLAGREVAPLEDNLLSVADKIEHYLQDWQARVNDLDTSLGEFEALILLGRGASMGAVWNGALTNKEAAKFPLEGLHAAEFRHGPLELAAPGFCALIFAGTANVAMLNRKLALDIQKHGGRALWLDVKSDPALPTIAFPETSELTRPLVEILPMQMLTLVMAGRKKVTAGQFRIIGKVTTSE